MTNLELAQQQGNQAAPNLLDAANAGELGGGGSVIPSLSTAGLVMADVVFALSSDQADEAAANTIYANYKLVTDNHIDFFMLSEVYTDGSEGSETSQYPYLAFSARTLAHIKKLVALNPEESAEILEILEAIEPDELCTFDFDDETIINLVMTANMSSMFGLDELPPMSSGAMQLTFEQPSTGELMPWLPLPEGSSVYKLEIAPVGIIPSDANQVLTAISYYAESLLDTPVKLDKTYYMYPIESRP